MYVLNFKSDNSVVKLSTATFCTCGTQYAAHQSVAAAAATKAAAEAGTAGAGEAGASMLRECPAGQRRGPAAPAEDMSICPRQKYILTPTLLTTSGRTRRSSMSIPLSTVSKSNARLPIADWPGFHRASARREIFL